MNVGKRVIKNPLKWQPNDFDGWGRGQGIGKIVESPEGFEDVIDVKWPGGRCFENDDQIIIENEKGEFWIHISHEEVQNLHHMKKEEADHHFEMYYGWKSEMFEHVLLMEESTRPTLILALKEA
jgi:hypothetical protein